MFRSQGFSRYELLIVLATMMVLAGVLGPQFLNLQSEHQEENLVTDLSFIRSALYQYQLDHQGLAAGTLDQEASERHLNRQLVGKTRLDGAASPDGEFGPYLPAGLPPNPFSGLYSVRISTEPAVPLADETTGWIYHPPSGTFLPNLRGEAPSGKAFSSF